jgi:prepilin-type N-terminal cleavage/methylation domain-containing protein
VRTDRRGESGFTLVELLIAMTLMLLVVGATLAVFSTMERRTRDDSRLSDQERTARVAVDTLAKRLRNLASPQSAGAAPQALERAQAQDLMFRTVASTGTSTTANPENLERYRYCLGTDGRLYAERQANTNWTATPPSPTSCGTSDGWSGDRTVVAQNLVNGARPVFRYQMSPTPGTYSESTSVTQTNFPNDIAIRAELFVDLNANAAPGPTTINTRVFLRNQNRPPTAKINATYQTALVTLNASDSADPENNPLYYQWSDNGSVVQAFSQQATYAFRPTTSGTHVISLVVRDIGGLQVTSNTLTVTCTTPNGTPTCSGPSSA